VAFECVFLRARFAHRNPPSRLSNRGRFAESIREQPSDGLSKSFPKGSANPSISFSILRLSNQVGSGSKRTASSQVAILWAAVASRKLRCRW
jgi:hypothetical protein